MTGHKSMTTNDRVMEITFIYNSLGFASVLYQT